MNFKIIAVLDSLFGSFCLFLAELLSSGKRSLPEKADTIAVLKFLGNGSLILAAPALYAIKVRHPHIRLILYTTVTLQAHAGMLQLFDEIILLSPGRPASSRKKHGFAAGTFQASSTGESRDNEHPA